MFPFPVIFLLRLTAICYDHIPHLVIDIHTLAIFSYEMIPFNLPLLSCCRIFAISNPRSCCTTFQTALAMIVCNGFQWAGTKNAPPLVFSILTGMHVETVPLTLKGDIQTLVCPNIFNFPVLVYRILNNQALVHQIAAQV
jgi:hypothetical protein